MHQDLRELLQDRNGDGVIDYINARIYVPDNAGPLELAAAANLAACLAVESTTMDLPIAFPLSRYSAHDDTPAIIIGKTVENIVHGSARVLALSPTEALSYAEVPAYPGVVQDTPRSGARLSLANLYTSGGLLSDNDGDDIPESVNTRLFLGPDVHAIAVIDLAARIALEGAKVRLPLVMAGPPPFAPGNAILIGATSPLVKAWINDGTVVLPRQAGRGIIQVVDDESIGESVLVVAGSDDAGEMAALRYLATQFPYIGKYGKDSLPLRSIENDVRRFVEVRSPAGQAAAGLCTARHLTQSHGGSGTDRSRLHVVLDGDCPGYLNYLRLQFPAFDTVATSLDIQHAPLVFEFDTRLPWEGHAAMDLISKRVLPHCAQTTSIAVELRLSESPEVRAALVAQIRQLLIDGGAQPDRTDVRVLSAYKQGYSWIDEVLKPRLTGAARIRIFFSKAQTTDRLIESPFRWQHELYPVDAVLARDLAIEPGAITFHGQDRPGYRVVAEDRNGEVVLDESFEPRWAIRPLFDVFPDYADVRVTTGWLHAVVDGSTVADERVLTDPELAWNQFQADVLPGIRAYLANLYKDESPRDSAPHFGTLDVELWLSEPDYTIGIDEERISTLEALHEDFYFETLLFLDLCAFGSYPGRIIPRVHRSTDATDGRIRVRLTGKSAPYPLVELSPRMAGSPANRHRLSPRPAERPRIVAITIDAGESGVASLHVAVHSDQEVNAALQALRELHQNGVGQQWLSYELLGELVLGKVSIPHTGSWTLQPTIRTSRDLASPSVQAVQQQTPIGPPECLRWIEQLAAFPQARPFVAGHSYLGNPVWAIEVTNVSDGTYRSQVQLSLAKPVLFVTGRQHANEVSSTSHILALIEALITAPRQAEILQRIHFIVQPITNPDGAALLEELQPLAPGLMMHACYFGALGVDISDGQWNEDPLYPEARVRRDLWDMWHPDVVLNPHGYPSHEWVQLFGGYTAWMRSRDHQYREWWIPRGWFVPGVDYAPENHPLVLQLLEQVASTVRDTMGPVNRRLYERYEKYRAGIPDSVPPEFLNGTMVHARAGTRPQSFPARNPKVTLLELVTEAPDEVAYGPWLQMVANAGLECSLAIAKFMASPSFQWRRSKRATAVQSPNNET